MHTTGNMWEATNINNVPTLRYGKHSLSAPAITRARMSAQHSTPQSGASTATQLCLVYRQGYNGTGAIKQAGQHHQEPWHTNYCARGAITPGSELSHPIVCAGQYTRLGSTEAH